MFKRIYIEIGNICNLRCSFCPPVGRKPRQMLSEEFDQVCRKVRPYTDTILLHVMGEPLLHPKLEKLLDIAEAYGFKTDITTNGTLLPAKGQILLNHPGTVHRVSISLHSMEGNDVSGRKLQTNIYLENCIRFADQAAAIGIFSVFRLWNLDSDDKKGSHQDNPLIEASLKQHYADNWEKRYSGFRMARNIFLEYAGIFTWPEESTAEEVQQGRCRGAVDQLAVLADGTVVPCCLDSEGRIPLGNLFLQDLPDILSSRRFTAMCDGFRKGVFTEDLCKKCTYARRFS